MDYVVDPFGYTPPPCPVDDTPFTACTPESVARQHAHQHQHVVVLGVAEPQRVIVLRAGEEYSPAPIAAEVVGPAVSTKDYRGKNPRRPRGVR